MNKRHLKIDNHYVSILLVIVFSCILSVVGYMVSSVFSFTTIKQFLSSPLLFLLNTIPLTLFMLLVYFASSRLWVTFSLGSIFFIIVNYINRLKMGLRYEPFVPGDLFLGNESTNIVKLSELPLDRMFYFIFGVIIVFSLFLFLFVKSKKISVILRVSGVLITVAVSVALYYTCYNNVALYDGFKVYGSKYSQVDLVKSKGFSYSFLVKAHSVKTQKPVGYSEDYVKSILDKYKSNSKSNKKPHVIAIMSEAFFDIDRVPNIKFNKGYNVLENYNKIKKQSYSGSIVTSVFGGGTAYTEFSFLTGQKGNVVKGSGSPYVMYIKKDTYAIPRIFKNEGYNTTAIHPGHEWFYNRYTVYDYLGFDKKGFRKNMNITDSDLNSNKYVKDITTYEFLINDFYTYLDENNTKPYFNFTVTIENHTPYKNQNIGNPEVVKRKSINDSYYNVVNNYAYELMQCDKALGYLVDELENTDEPIVLVYFSDHMPFLGENYGGYTAMNYDLNPSGNMQSYLNTYKVPYFIWSNKSAKKQLKDNGNPVPKGKAPTISANYLSAELLSYIGIKSSPYFNYLNEIKTKMPVITDRLYKTDSGKFTETLSESQSKILSDYEKIQYYMLFKYKVD